MHRYPASTAGETRVRSARPRAIALVALAALAFAAVCAPPESSDSQRPIFAASAHAAETPRAAAEHKSARAKKSRGPRDTPFGREGDPRKATRTIRIETSDTMRYFPDHVTVKKGQTVRFNVRNAGALPHEMVIGTMDDLKKHAEMARKNPEMKHDGANIAHVEPGQTGRIVWHFTRAGEFYYGCLVPGHFDAGMIGTIVVR